MSVYGLADCNNFFVSCERVFRPALEGCPAVVLSSNDCCICYSARRFDADRRANPLRFFDSGGSNFCAE